jgi:Copper type II ascorbate-dependent monooxygenase, C-terminal domain
MTRAIGLAVLLLAPAVAAEAAPRTVRVRTSRFTVAPRTEREVCQVVKVPLRAAIEVDQIAVTMPSTAQYASHHFAIFLYTGSDDETLPTEPFDARGCVGGMGGQGVSPILAFVQQPRQRIRFPRGVGITLRPGQRLLLNSHYVNGGDAAANVAARVTFRAARRGSIVHHVRTFELGTADILVPPGMAGGASASWTAPLAMNVISLTSHSHKHTTSATIDVVRAAGDSEQLLVTLDWANPTVERFVPPRRLEPGDALRWTCDYLNTTDELLHFGLRADDEMCFATGFFYPDDDAAPLPRLPVCAGGDDSFVCPFN